MLTRKFLLLTIPALILMALMDFLMVDQLVTSKFDRIEVREAIQNAQRIHDAIERELYHLESLCVDWSAWDDAYDFMVTRDEDYLDSNLIIDTFRDNQFNLIMFIKPDGTTFWKRIVDLETEEDISVTLFEQTKYPPKHLLLANTIEERMAGLVHTEKGLCMYARSPILTSENEGPSRGTMIMAKFFNHHYQEILCDQTRIHFDVKLGKMNQQSTPGKYVRKNDNDFMIDRSHPDTLMIISRLPSINGVEYYIESTINRDFMKEGKRTVFLLYLSLMIIGSAILLVVLIGIQFMVIRPIKKLKEHALFIAENQVSGKKLYPNRKDEIGILAQEFDQVFDNLIETRSRLLESSYKSGLAEMASNFLHNLRNSLTPLMGEIQGIRFACRNVDLEKYQKVHKELSSDETDLERKKKIREYLVLLDQRNLETMDEIKQQFNALDDYRQSIEKLMDTQSRWTSAKPVVEKMKLSEIGKEIQSFLSLSVARRLNISIRNERKKDEIIRTYRVTLLMILARLLEYILEGQSDNGIVRIVILIDQTEQDDNSFIVFRIMVPQSMHLEKDIASVFALDRQNNTKPLSGDLLWCSNTASVIGAKLDVVESEGGTNSYFFLIVPIIEEAGGE